MSTINTSRLFLEPLQLEDSKFILELVNTKGWLKFIGDRKVTNEAEAENYIRKILDNSSCSYFVFRLKLTSIPIGIITLIKRDYLDYPDIGFSLLPQHEKQGFAFEASQAVIHFVKDNPAYEQLTAITLSENHKSIALLEKLGLVFEKEIEENEETLLLYRIKLKS